MLKINWAKMESQIRGVLRTAASYPDNPQADAGDLALLLMEISDIVGLETGRGMELDNSPGAREKFLQRFGVGGKNGN